MPTQQSALKIFHKMKEASLGVKNIPDALVWHFAPHWTALEQKIRCARNDFWEASSSLLSRSIAIPIGVKMGDDLKAKICEVLLDVKV